MVITMSNASATVFMKKVGIALRPRSTLLRTRLKNGAVVAGFNQPGYGARTVYLYADEAEPELTFLQHFLGRGYVFLDVGANIGIYSVKAAKEVGPEGLVISVEPFIESAYRLSQNIALNGYNNVRIRTVCVGSSTGEERLYLNRNRPVSFSVSPVEDAASISILSVSLDDLCRWEKLTRLDYLKIDAEGAEAAILQGAEKTIRELRPIIQVEITKATCNLPDSYCAFSAPNSPNSVFIPIEKTEAVETARNLGWTPNN
jgi:FkbM family methyltransferase